MWLYWLLFIVPAIQSLSNPVKVNPFKVVEKWTISWQSLFLVLTLIIGMRHQVGGDWGNYLANLQDISILTFAEAVKTLHADPTDHFLNWFASFLGLGIYFVNSIYALFFTWGLLVFCRGQPQPWLAVTVSVPYLITVVAMGYSRQSVAIGLAMLGLVALENKRIFKFLLFIVLASSIHKSAIILVPLAALTITRQRMLMFLLICATAILLFWLLLQEYIESLTMNYIDAKYESSGAWIRIAMNALPATLFLLTRKRFQLTSAQQSFWTWMSCSAIAFVGILYISPSSTAVDRVALYWIPLQLFVWSRFPDAMGRSRVAKIGWIFAVVCYCAAVHFVWLFFADNASSWLPYKFYPLVWLWQ
jgi:hypothetical protein